MNRLLSVFLLALLCFATNSFAQSRGIGGRQVVVDNGSGGQLTIIYNGVGNDTLRIGNDGLGGAAFPPATAGQTLRYTGEGFDSSSTLFNTGTQVHTRGGLVHALRSINSSTQLTEGDHIVIAHYSQCDSLNITLPEPSAGRVIVARLVYECQECGECQGGGVRIFPYADELIDGWSDYSLFPWSPTVTLVSDGTDWYVIGSTFGGF
jgi:hypothetical protein